VKEYLERKLAGLKPFVVDCTIAAAALWAWNGLHGIAHGRGHGRGVEKASQQSSLRHGILSGDTICTGTHHEGSEDLYFAWHIITIGVYGIYGIVAQLEFIWKRHFCKYGLGEACDVYLTI